LYQRLANLGLVQPRNQGDLKAFLDQFAVGKSSRSGNTIRNIGQARNWLFKHFPETRSVRSITKADADGFHAFLRDSHKSGNTVSSILKKVKQAFSEAAERGELAINPFAHIQCPIRSNPERMEFVRQEWTDAILKACPDLQWKVIFVMARYAGVRVPSELKNFTWGDIRWDKDRIRIHDSKRSRPDEPVIRIVPMFPEIRPILTEAYNQALEGSVYVCPRACDGSTNLRTQMHRIIKRAKLKPWQRVFQNMRSTRETELAEHFPMHVVSGNTESVAVEHYLQTTAEHFDRAAKGEFDGNGFEIDVDAIFEEAARNQAQSEQNSTELPTTDDDTKKAQASEESEACASSRSGSSGDENPSVPPTGVEPVSSG